MPLDPPQHNHVLGRTVVPGALRDSKILLEVPGTSPPLDIATSEGPSSVSLADKRTLVATLKGKYKGIEAKFSGSKEIKIDIEAIDVVIHEVGLGVHQNAWFLWRCLGARESTVKLQTSSQIAADLVFEKLKETMPSGSISVAGGIESGRTFHVKHPDICFAGTVAKTRGTFPDSYSVTFPQTEKQPASVSPLKKLCKDEASGTAWPEFYKGTTPSVVPRTFIALQSSDEGLEIVVQMDDSQPKRLKPNIGKSWKYPKVMVGSFDYRENTRKMVVVAIDAKPTSEGCVTFDQAVLKYPAYRIRTK